MHHDHSHMRRRFRGMTAEAMRAAADAMEASGDAAGPQRATTRVQLELPPQAMDRLQRLKDKTEAASYAEVIRNALRLFEALVDEHEKGAEFSLKRADGETVAYQIFV
jgi:Arc/MetJ-type ribon-helix-helix transcriptional regulator